MPAKKPPAAKPQPDVTATVAASVELPKGPAVLRALQQVQLELGPIAKRKVDAVGYSYQAFSVDDVYTALAPLFAKHGVFLAPQPSDVSYTDRQTSGGKLQVEAHVLWRGRLYGLDGEFIPIAFESSARDTSDKAPVQAAQLAAKYAMVQAFMIATGGPDAEQLHEAEPSQRLQPVAPAEPPITDDEIAERRTNAVKTAVYDLAGEDTTEATKLLVIAMERSGVEKIVSESDADRVVKEAEKIMAVEVVKPEEPAEVVDEAPL